MKPLSSTARRTFFLVLLMTAITTPPHRTSADQPWSQFRGFHHNGEAPQTATPPTEWDANHFVWATNIPGTGWSSPVLDGERIWLTTAISQDSIMASPAVFKNDLIIRTATQLIRIRGEQTSDGL